MPPKKQLAVCEQCQAHYCFYCPVALTVGRVGGLSASLNIVTLFKRGSERQRRLTVLLNSLLFLRRKKKKAHSLERSAGEQSSRLVFENTRYFHRSGNVLWS